MHLLDSDGIGIIDANSSQARTQEEDLDVLNVILEAMGHHPDEIHFFQNQFTGGQDVDYIPMCHLQPYI